MNLEKYYIAFEKNPDIYFDQAIFIEDGIVPQSVPFLLWDKQLYTFPVQIAQWGLCLENRFLNGEIELINDIMNIADYLVDHAQKDNAGISWDMQIERAEYGLISPWKSAMAQGEIISFMLRASEITNNTKYSKICHEAYNTMLTPIENGGVLGNFPNGSDCLEEYPTSKSNCVLNGMIFALFGVYDYAIFFDQSLDDFNDLTENLADNLLDYDLGFWSRYDLYGNPKSSSKIYHWLHIIQLAELSKLSSEHSDLFLSYSNKWDRQQNSILCRFLRNFSRVFQTIFYRR